MQQHLIFTEVVTGSRLCESPYLLLQKAELCLDSHLAGRIFQQLHSLKKQNQQTSKLSFKLRAYSRTC